MSGHSKWANIKRQKAVVDAKKGVTYAKMSREIMTAVKLAGSDPDLNVRLRQAIDKAKAEGVPNENISRAIDKACGNLNNSQMENLVYEGYGPSGVAIIVKCQTDNRNRTAGDVRSYFSKYGGNLGESGCVNWMFVEKGIIEIEPGNNIEDVITLAIDNGANDIDDSQIDSVSIYCKPENLVRLTDRLENLAKIKSFKIETTPNIIKEVENFDAAKQLLKLIDILENHDDVDEVIANFDISEEWLIEISKFN